MNLVERANAPTPKLFKILRTIGLVLLAASGSVMAAPITLPAAVVTVASYLAVAGGVMTAVSQVTVDDAANKGLESGNASKKSGAGNRLGRDPDFDY